MVIFIQWNTIQVCQFNAWRSTRVVHGSLFLDPTRPDPTRRNGDPTRPTIVDKKSDPTRPPPPYELCFTSSTLKLLTRNNIQLLHDFEGNTGKYFSSGLVMFLEGIKKISSGLINFVKTVVSRQRKDCQTPKSEQFLPCKVQADQPVCQTRPNVYEFNIASILYQPAIVILIIYRTDKKSLSNWTNWTN